MNQEKMIETVTTVVAKVLQVKQEAVEPATVLKDLGATEFDMIEMIMQLEQELGIIINDDVTNTFESVHQMVAHLNKRVQK